MRRAASTRITTSPGTRLRNTESTLFYHVPNVFSLTSRHRVDDMRRRALSIDVLYKEERWK
jgi:hypothetical protein